MTDMNSTLVTAVVRMISKDPSRPYGFCVTEDIETGEPIDAYIPASYLVGLVIGSKIAGRLVQLPDAKYRILDVTKVNENASEELAGGTS